MCGRYTLKTTGRELQDALQLTETPKNIERYNIPPMSTSPVILNRGPRVLTTARWGLLPVWAKDTKLAAKLTNARAETITEKPTFREPLKKRTRCLIPCDGFYEWKRDEKSKVPYFISIPEVGVLTMAGLFSVWKSPEGVEVVTYTVITTGANEQMAAVHNRMPVFLVGAQRDEWLSDAELDLTAFLKPWAGTPLSLYPVSSYVNNARNQGPDCIKPAQA